jgi:hypothetical protein
MGNDAVTALARVSVNDAVFAYLDPVGPPPPRRARDPYLEAGHHPDIVERVWKGLGAGLPPDARCLANGNPVLAHRATGAVLALPRGTSYALWLTPDDRDGCGLSTSHRWGNGTVTDLAERLGEGWFWGCFDEREPLWCVAAHRWWNAVAQG